MRRAVKKPNDEWLCLNAATPDYAQLTSFASRIAKLLGTAGGPEPALGDCLDDLLGAIHGLMLAKHYRFTDRIGQAKEAAPPRVRATRAGEGKLRLNGKWMAGYHLNNALYRVDSVYHRLLLLILAVSPDTHTTVPTLSRRMKHESKRWQVKWSSGHLDKVHQEVIALKHRPLATGASRTVRYDEVRGSVAELLNLVEAWQNHY